MEGARSTWIRHNYIQLQEQEDPVAYNAIMQEVMDGYHSWSLDDQMNATLNIIKGHSHHRSMTYINNPSLCIYHYLTKICYKYRASIDHVN